MLKMEAMNIPRSHDFATTTGCFDMLSTTRGGEKGSLIRGGADADAMMLAKLL